MNTKFADMVLTKQAAARITGWYASEIENVVLKGDLVVVVKNTGYSTAFPKSKFIGDFIYNRKKRAQGLIAIQNKDHRNIFEVSSGSGNGHYEVTLTRHGAVCNCADFRNQLEAFEGDGCCKHCYSTLFGLGFKDLKEYREAWNVPGATLEKIILTQQEKMQVAEAI